MRNATLTVDPSHLHTIAGAGARTRALEHFARHGVALWLRGDGRATLFYRDPVTGRRRRSTWKRFTLKPRPAAAA